MEKGIIRLVVILFLIHETTMGELQECIIKALRDLGSITPDLLQKHTLVPCPYCARNAEFLNNQCVCQTGGDPYFNCQDIGSYYCTLRKTSVLTFNNESARIQQSSLTPLALLTTRRNARLNGVCEFNLSVNVAEGPNEALELVFFLKQRDILSITANVSMKIKSYFLYEYITSEIYYRPIGELSYTLVTILRSTDSPLGSGQSESFGCPVTYGMMTDDLTVVNIPCCGLELGLRPDTTKAYKTISGVYLKVTRASVTQPQPSITTGGSEPAPPCAITNP